VHGRLANDEGDTLIDLAGLGLQLVVVVREVKKTNTSLQLHIRLPTPTLQFAILQVAE
jgi:hypothetical protein